MSELWLKIRASAGNNPGTPALSIPGSSISVTYAQLVKRVEKLANFMGTLKPGPIGLLADNGIDWIITDLACVEAQKCLVPVPTFFTPGQREHALDDVGAEHLVAPVTTRLPANYRLTGRLPGADGLGLWQITGGETDFDLAGIALDAQKITYTSGSTGFPKGVCLSADHLAEVAGSVDIATRGIAIKRHLCVLPLSTLLENVAGVYAPLLRGAEVLVPALHLLGLHGSSSFHAEQFLRYISLSDPGSLIVTPQLLDCLVQATLAGWQPPPSLRFIAVGGGKVSQRLIEQASAAGLPTYQGYGLSECGSVVSLNLPGNDRPGSVGKPLPHANVSIHGGEIHIGGALFLGYTGNSDPKCRSMLPTGDVGYIDDQGFLFVTGRKKNLIISSFGRNISPEWVEAELTSIPGIRQAFVAGDGHPYLIALLVTLPGVDEKSLHAAIEAMNMGLPDYARVRRWTRIPGGFSVANGTLTENGRLRRARILAMYRQKLEKLLPTPDLPAVSTRHDTGSSRMRSSG